MEVSHYTPLEFSHDLGPLRRSLGSPYNSIVGEFLISPAKDVMAVKRGPDVEPEIAFLREFRKDPSRPSSIPDLVYVSSDGLEFGIKPVGAPFDPIGFTRNVPLRKVLWDVMEAIKWLQTKNIVHRDVRAANIVVDGSQGVLIDFDNAIDITAGPEGFYLGGYVCCPERHIVNVMEYGWEGCTYTPMLKDDCYAFVLLMVHCLFPHLFEGFRFFRIGIKNSDESEMLISLWNDLRNSRIWGPFLMASENVDWDTLEMMLDMVVMFRTRTEVISSD